MSKSALHNLEGGPTKNGTNWRFCL